MGFSQKYVQKLLGHCGSMDVEDVFESVYGVEESVSWGFPHDGCGFQLYLSIEVLLERWLAVGKRSDFVFLRSEWFGEFSGFWRLSDYIDNDTCSRIVPSANPHTLIQCPTPTPCDRKLSTASIATSISMAPEWPFRRLLPLDHLPQWLFAMCSFAMPYQRHVSLDQSFFSLERGATVCFSFWSNVNMITHVILGPHVSINHRSTCVCVVGMMIYDQYQV